MRLSTFACLIMILTAGWMQFYAQVRELYNGVNEYKEQIVRLKEHNENEHLAMALEREQFLEFRQSVAAMMPDVLKQKGMGEQGYVYRSLASTVSRGEAEVMRKAIAKTLFERGKEHFRKKEYPQANRCFQQIIDRYGFTTYVPESYFLLAESYFQQKQYEESTGIIQQMVEL